MDSLIFRYIIVYIYTCHFSYSTHRLQCTQIYTFSHREKNPQKPECYSVKISHTYSQQNWNGVQSEVSPAYFVYIFHQANLTNFFVKLTGSIPSIFLTAFWKWPNRWMRTPNHLFYKVILQITKTRIVTNSKWCQNSHFPAS